MELLPEIGTSFLIDLEELLEREAALLSAMANTKRLIILQLLTQKEASVGEIAEHVGLSQSAVSQHLRVFRMNKMVKTRRSGQTVFYFDPSDAVRRIIAVLPNTGSLGKALNRAAATRMSTPGAGKAS